jgi:hypothetical protein
MFIPSRRSSKQDLVTESLEKIGMSREKRGFLASWNIPDKRSPSPPLKCKVEGKCSIQSAFGRDDIPHQFLGPSQLFVLLRLDLARQLLDRLAALSAASSEQLSAHPQPISSKHTPNIRRTIWRALCQEDAAAPRSRLVGLNLAKAEISAK